MVQLTGRLIISMVFLVFFAHESHAQKSALIIIDMQEFYFPGGDMPLNEPGQAAGKAAEVIRKFRAKNDLVIHIKHDYEPGGAIHPLVSPVDNELVFTKKTVNAFLGTPIDSVLRSKGITEVVFCGMQTHMCLEAATRAASDLGYKCTVIGDACATRDLKYGENLITADQVHYSTLATLQAYAEILNLEEFLQ